MDSAVLGLGAVAWAEAWNGTQPEASLRLPIDAARLLELLRGLPVARALLSDLQRAESAGRPVQLIVSADRQIVEIATGAGHYLLPAAARNSVLAALAGRLPPPVPAADRAASAAARASADPAGQGVAPSRPSPGAGILWESPSAAPRDRPAPESIALPWLGPDARLEVERDGGRRPAGVEEEPAVVAATLHLELPQVGCFDAHIRVCGAAVAVSIDCPGAQRVESRLPALQQQLSARGLVSAHVGLAKARSG